MAAAPPIVGEDRQAAIEWVIHNELQAPAGLRFTIGTGEGAAVARGEVGESREQPQNLTKVGAVAIQVQKELQLQRLGEVKELTLQSAHIGWQFLEFPLEYPAQGYKQAIGLSNRTLGGHRVRQPPNVYYLPGKVKYLSAKGEEAEPNFTPHWKQQARERSCCSRGVVASNVPPRGPSSAA